SRVRMTRMAISPLLATRTLVNTGRKGTGTGWRFWRTRHTLAVARGERRTTGGRAVSTTAPAAGWYQDPYGQAESRYWDGARWTDDVHSSASPSPAAAAAPAAMAPAAMNGQVTPQLALPGDGNLS